MSNKSDEEIGDKGFRITAVDADVNAPNLAKWFDNISDWDKEGDIKMILEL